MPPFSARQSGFTVVEVLIALLLLSVGILGLVGTSAIATRMVGDARRQLHAVAAGRGVVERLRSGPCPSEGGGAVSRGSHLVRWTVSSAGAGTARRVLVVVRTPGLPAARVDTIAALVPC